MVRDQITFYVRLEMRAFRGGHVDTELRLLAYEIST